MSLDAIKGGKLIQYGVSLGGAYALHVPVKLTDFTAEDVTSSFMPYIVGYPLMFFPGSGQETRAYCSAYWAFTPRKDAQDIADKHARRRAGPGLSDDAVESKTGWKPGRAATCGYRLIGIYVGKPLSISPTVKPEKGLEDATPESTSIFSAGLAWSPNIAFSLLAGASLWRFPAEKIEAIRQMTSNENRSFWTCTVALGGNTDIVSALVR